MKAAQLLSLATSFVGRLIVYPSLAISMFIMSALAHAESQCERKGESVTTFGEEIEFVGLKNISTANRDLKLSFTDSNPIYIRLQFNLLHAGAGDWTVLISDEKGKPVLALQESSFSDGVPSDGGILLWTPRLNAALLRIRLFASDAGLANKLEIKVSNIVVMPEKQDRLIFSAKSGAAPDYVSLYHFSGQGVTNNAHTLELGSRVGMLVGRGMNNSGEVVSWCCTVFFLSERLALTNWHCGAANDSGKWKDPVSNLLIDSNWIGDFVGNGTITVTGTHAEYRVRKIVGDPNEGLDYALLEVFPTRENRLATSYLPPFKINADVKTGEDLFMIHHAGCRPKAISMSCRVKASKRPGWKTSEKETEFSHNCDTEGGSSGAPVFNAKGELVGIHHLGFAMADGKCDEVNKAIAISSILEDLKNSPLPEVKRALSEFDIER